MINVATDKDTKTLLLTLTLISTLIGIAVGVRTLKKTKDAEEANEVRIARLEERVDDLEA
tara:strand:- start:686 stop:865 length:180 start_codon:yes stop_codon:yes gene_type:complete